MVSKNLFTNGDNPYLWVMEKMKMIFSPGFLFSQAFWSTLFAPFVEDQTSCSTEARRL